MPHRIRRSLRVALPTSVVIAALLVGLVPAFATMAGRGPVKTHAREVTVQVDHSTAVQLPIAATHVAFHWTGKRAAHVTVALGSDGRTFGDEIAIEPADAAEGDAGETYSGVVWTGGGTWARLTADRPLGKVTVVAIDAGASAPEGPVAAAATLQPSIVTRAAWGADESLRFDAGGHERFPPQFAPLQMMVVHHTAGRNSDPDPYATVRAIYYFDAVTRGWGDMGYSWLIDEQGRIYEGRHARAYGAGEAPTEEDLAGNVIRGAHAMNHNMGTIGIAVLGTFDTVLPTTAARTSLENLLAWEADRHGIDPTSQVEYVNPEVSVDQVLNAISGHRDVNVTDCPGNLFYSWFPTLRQHVAARIAATSGANDATAPTLKSITPMVPSPTGSHTIPFGLIFSEPIAGLTAADLTVGGSSTGWSIDTITGIGAVRTVTLKADAPTAGDVSLTLKAGSIADLAGHPGPAADASASATWAQDDTPPSVVLYATRSNTTEPAWDFTATFSEPVVGFEPADISIAGTSDAVTPWTVQRTLGAGTAWAFTLENLATTPADGTIVVSLPGGGIGDLAGNGNTASNTVTVMVDTKPPVLVTPITWLRSAVTYGTTQAARVTWAASDAVSGVKSYDVARSVDGAAFAIVASGITATQLNVSLTPGHSYRYEVRARDNAGNLSAWKVGATARPATIQNGSSLIAQYGTWTVNYSTSYSGGSVRYTTANGARQTLTTTARSMAFVTTRAPSRGKVAIYVDGAYVTTIDLYSATTQYRYVAYSRTWVSAGTHTLRIVGLGTSGRPRVDLDAFLVLR